MTRRALNLYTQRCGTTAPQITFPTRLPVCPLPLTTYSTVIYRDPGAHITTGHAGYHIQAAGPGPGCPGGQSRLLGTPYSLLTRWTGQQGGSEDRVGRSSPGGLLEGNGARVELPPSPAPSSGLCSPPLQNCTPIPFFISFAAISLVVGEGWGSCQGPGRMGGRGRPH